MTLARRTTFLRGTPLQKLLFHACDKENCRREKNFKAILPPLTIKFSSVVLIMQILISSKPGLSLNSLIQRSVRNKLPVSEVAACGQLGILQRRSTDISWCQTRPLLSRHLCCEHHNPAHTSADQALQHPLMSTVRLFSPQYMEKKFSSPKTDPLLWSESF